MQYIRKHTIPHVVGFIRAGRFFIERELPEFDLRTYDLLIVALVGVLAFIIWRNTAKRLWAMIWELLIAVFYAVLVALITDLFITSIRLALAANAGMIDDFQNAMERKMYDSFTTVASTLFGKRNEPEL